MKERDKSIDFLRATAILFMTITHVNSLFYLGKSPILDIFTALGATVCFSVFLFASAYVTGIKIKNNSTIKIESTLKRILEIYIVYIILGILITFVIGSEITTKQITDIVLLRSIPEFTEFLIAFIVFTIFTQLFFKQLKYFLSKPILLILLGITVYVVGVVIYNLTTNNTYPDTVRILLEHTVGYGNLHRFPLTYYFPIFVFGLLLSKYSNIKTLLIITIISLFSLLILRITGISRWYRWPPSVAFLLYGFVYIPLVILIYKKFTKFFSTKILTMFSNMGKYALEQLFLSTFLIFASLLFLNPSQSPITSILMNIIVISALLLHPIVFHPKMV